MSLPGSLSKNIHYKAHRGEGIYDASGYCIAKQRDDSIHAAKGPRIRNQVKPYDDWEPFAKAFLSTPLEYFNDCTTEHEFPL